MNWIERITLLGIALTFAASVWSLLSTRRNLKTTKYIEIITSERIKWLSIVRNEVAELVTNIQYVITKLQFDISNRDQDYQEYLYDKYSSVEGQLEEMQSANMNIGVDENIKKWSETDYITKLRLLQLRFNPHDDQKILKSVEFFIDFFSRSEIHRDILPQARKHIQIIMDETQDMLKREWEKVKKESRGKRN